MNLPVTVAWTDEGIRVLDQTLLPGEVRHVTCRTVEEAVEAIRSLRVRGAPAIGVMAGFALALALRVDAPRDRTAFLAAVERHRRRIAEARPTAVNLAWALNRVAGRVTASAIESPAELQELLLAEAERIAEEDRELCDGIGRAGASLVPEGAGVLTHCNAGALATAGSGTALSPLYRAWEEGRRFEVFADETRPLLQGARLTAWELGEAGIPVTILCDGAAASLLASGRVGLVIVGADRIAANGDTANKIGTYAVALAAEAHGVPFYVAAPSSTFDLALPDGGSIPIEQRGEGEVRGVPGRTWAAAGARTWNPAFDITPARLVRGFVTEKGILRPPYGPAIRGAFGSRRAGA